MGEHDYHGIRGELDDRSGLHLFAFEIDGSWHAGWFRIRDGKLEVSSNYERRIVEYDAENPDSLMDLLRRLLTEIAHGSPESATVAAEGKAVSDPLHSSNSTFIFASDSAKEPERPLSAKGRYSGEDNPGADRI